MSFSSVTHSSLPYRTVPINDSNTYCNLCNKYDCNKKFHQNNIKNCQKNEFRGRRNINLANQSRLNAIHTSSERLPKNGTETTSYTIPSSAVSWSNSSRFPNDSKYSKDVSEYLKTRAHCDACDKYFYNNYYLEKHKARMHKSMHSLRLKIKSNPNKDGYYIDSFEGHHMGYNDDVTMIENTSATEFDNECIYCKYS